MVDEREKGVRRVSSGGVMSCHLSEKETSGAELDRPSLRNRFLVRENGCPKEWCLIMDLTRIRVSSLGTDLEEEDGVESEEGSVLYVVVVKSKKE